MAGRRVGSILLALLFLLLGYAMLEAGWRAVSSWSAISGWFGACGILWLAAGPAMFAGGVWILGSLGRSRAPLRIAGAAAILAGASLVAGVLTNVIPCSGPS